MQTNLFAGDVAAFQARQSAFIETRKGDHDLYSKGVMSLTLFLAPETRCCVREKKRMRCRGCKPRWLRPSSLDDLMLWHWVPERSFVTPLRPHSRKSFQGPNSSGETGSSGLLCLLHW